MYVGPTDPVRGTLYKNWDLLSIVFSLNEFKTFTGQPSEKLRSLPPLAQENVANLYTRSSGTDGHIWVFEELSIDRGMSNYC